MAPFVVLIEHNCNYYTITNAINEGLPVVKEYYSNFGWNKQTMLHLEMFSLTRSSFHYLHSVKKKKRGKKIHCLQQ